MVIERIKRNNPWKTLAKCLPHNKCSALIKMNLRAHTETLLLLFISRQKYSKNYVNYYAWPKENRSMQKHHSHLSTGTPPDQVAGFSCSTCLGQTARMSSNCSYYRHGGGWSSWQGPRVTQGQTGLRLRLCQRLVEG